MTELLIGAAAAVGLALWGWLRGAAAARRDREAADARRYGETVRRAGDADVGGGDPADDREWLRDRGQR